MRRSIIGALACLALVYSPVQAQNQLLGACATGPTYLPSRPPPNVVQVVEEQYRLLCSQAVNALTDLQPSVGIAFSGGNPVLGTATTLGTRAGSIPRISVTARANVAFARVPDVFTDAAAGRLEEGGAGAQAALEAMKTLGVPLAALQGDVQIGLFKGIDIAPMIGGVGAIDLLGSVAFVPAIEDVGLTKSIINAGIGARVGLLEQGLVVPGVSISALYRRMGDVSFGQVDVDNPPESDPASFTTNLNTLSVRGVVSKGIAMFDLAVGAGYDSYSSDVAFEWALECETQECQNFTPGNDPLVAHGAGSGELSSAAWNVFGDVAMNLLMFNLVAEVGYQKPMDPITQDDLNNANLQNVSVDELTLENLDGGRFFGSLGIRLTL